MQQVLQPYMLLLDQRGEPLNNGFLYFGAPNQNPQSSPIQIFWDKDGLIPAAQPIRTTNGAPARDGTPAILFVNEAEYSFSAYDKNNRLLFAKNIVFFSGPNATPTTDGWMTAADKALLDSIPAQLDAAIRRSEDALNVANAAIPAVGGTSTGGIILPNYPYPTVPLQAVPRQYVDDVSVSVWGMLTGDGGTVFAQRNVSTVNKLATGLYVITFTTQLEDSNYAAMFNNCSPVPLGWYTVAKTQAAVTVQFFDMSGIAATCDTFDVLISSGRVG